MSDLILVETLEHGIVLVTLNRPDRRNALSIMLLEQLCDTIEHLERDPTNRVVILRGAGPVFSAGLDLKEAADRSLVEKSAAAVARSLDLLRSTSLIIIAAVIIVWLNRSTMFHRGDAVTDVLLPEDTGVLSEPLPTAAARLLEKSI